MIRYVLAVALAVAILGLGVTAIDSGATVRGETELATAIERVDAAAVDLYESEALALAGNPPPQRTVEVRLPGEASAAPDTVVFAREPGENLTRVTSRFPGRAEQSHVIEAPLSRAGEDRFRLDGHTGRVTLRLRLVADESGRPVVAVTVDV